MTLLAGFLDVVLRGLGLVAFSAAIGGVAFSLIVLRPAYEPSALARWARARALRLTGWGGAGLAAVQLALLVLKPWALASPGAAWPVAELLTTPFGIGSVTRMTVSLAFAAAAFRLAQRDPSPRQWVLLTVMAILLLANSAWLSHALGRLENRPMVMALDLLHRTGAAVWIGGLMHLSATWSVWRNAGDDGFAVRVLGRFSFLAMAAVGCVVTAGAGLTLDYVDSLAGLAGTGYGVMVLSKVILLAAALGLGALNFIAVRRLRRRVAPPALRLRWLVEAEIGLGITILLAAASLTSLPPTIDVREDRGSLAQVAARFLPRVPRLASPPIEELPVEDPLAPRTDADRAWSEYNHNVSGLFVLAIGLLACLERTGRVRWVRHWPLLLLGLAGFMFVRNDPGAWPLGPAGFWATMVLPNVLQHRLSVLLVVALGIFEWLVRTGRLRAPGWAYVFPLLCAAGGALLLTHSHAMFNLKDEFLTEVSHTPLGLLAVFVGWGRWLELRLPAPENRLPGRVWATAMVLVGALLVSYSEG